MPPQKLLQTKEREFWAWFRKIKPSALICINDKLAFTLIDMLKKNNINIPKDLSITGFDNLNWHSNSELTTIDFSMEEPVRVALAMLHKRLNEPKRTRTDSYIMIEPRIIERFSVDFHSS
jgi:DNA-binding LacI/PurR family transcriptional regulator